MDSEESGEIARVCNVYHEHILRKEGRKDRNKGSIRGQYDVN